MSPIGVTFACGRLLALAIGVAAAGAAVAQSTAPAAASAPKAAAKTPARPAAAKPFRPIIEARAVELLKAASDRLAAAKSMSFGAIASYGYPSRLGPPIVYTVRYEVVMQRPDKLEVVIPGDGPPSEFVIDGREMVAFDPAANLVAVAPAPATLEAALKQAYQAASIYFPFTDLLLPDPYAAISDGAILAYVVGPSAVVGGTKTEMVVWASNDVFMQLWIGADDQLPRRIRAIFRNDPRGLRHDLELSNWQLDGALAAETFGTAKAKAGQPMAFAAPGPKRPLPGRKAAAPEPAAKAP
ncbi:MAG: DUF2092 domain-containing protein [Burkholderiales bacterium]|nr:DUF2092 domain-containing protein [Burkholderiales bacterium]